MKCILKQKYGLPTCQHPDSNYNPIRVRSTQKIGRLLGDTGAIENASQYLKVCAKGPGWLLKVCGPQALSRGSYASGKDLSQD